jgi:hypothetical protein
LRDYAIGRVVNEHALRDHPHGDVVRLRQVGTGHPYLEKMWLSEPHFFQKDKTSTMLPQAKPASGSGTRPEAGFA